jgi:hypothetical protein
VDAGDLLLHPADAVIERLGRFALS